MLSRYHTATEARQRLIAARKELARRHPELAHRVMHIMLLEPRNNLKYLRISPDTIFASDNLDGVYGIEWILKATVDELVFVWAQFAIKFYEGWQADMRLTGRNRQWHNMAIDAVANARLRRDGIGKVPHGAVHFDEVGPDMDPLDAYDFVRGLYESYATTTDEVRRVHLDPEELAEIVNELEDRMPFPKDNYGLYELTVCCK